MKRHIFFCLMMILATLGSISAAEDSASAVGVVNVNTADAEQLQLLPRVGPALSERIVSFRESNGDFQKIDELLAVKGIGEKSLEPIRPYLAVSGETTLENKVKLPRRAQKAAEAS